MPRSKSSPDAVRDPVQVYLAPDDRKLLDSLAKATGLSRAEVLRRGIRSFAAMARSGGVKGPMLAYLEEAAGEKWPEEIAERHDEFLALQHSSS